MTLKDVYEKAIREDIDLVSSLEGYVKTEPEYPGFKYTELDAFVDRLKSERIFPTKVFGRVNFARYFPEKNTLEIFFEPAALEKRKHEEKISLKGMRTLDSGAGVYVSGSTERFGEAKVKLVWFYFPRSEKAEGILRKVPLYRLKRAMWGQPPVTETWACALVGEELVCGRVPRPL